MTDLGSISLENEMDLIVAHKRMVSIADYLQFTIVTQTTLATAVVEAGREVIDKTSDGYLIIGIINQSSKYFLFGRIVFATDANVRVQDEGLSYARKLVPAFELVQKGSESWIEMMISIPRFVQLNPEKLQQMQVHFTKLPPATPYEALKQKNQHLNKKNTEKEIQLNHSRYLNEKKSEFISIASHELKTPLTSIKAYTQLALKVSETECSPKVTEFLGKIDAQTEKLQRLIHQLLDVSTIESGKLEHKVEKVVLSGFIQDVIGMLRPILPNHILHFNNKHSKDVVSIDRLRMEQVFINLLNNAAKYSKPGTNIYVSCSALEPGIERITIQDEGIGMSQENLDKIFQKFFREEQAIGHYSGMGVGLYITRSIVEQHAGKIWAESVQGAGSSFHFTLPVIRIESN